jgi:hypothetical protein
MKNWKCLTNFLKEKKLAFGKRKNKRVIFPTLI